MKVFWDFVYGPLANLVTMCFILEMIRNRVVFGDFGFFRHHPVSLYILGVFFGGLVMASLIIFKIRIPHP
ncbi:MAG: hypothetical protein WCP91_01975 [Candidatus Berkelbacteria bacterium]